MENIKWMTDAAILQEMGKKIREWRLDLNQTQVQLAQKTQLSLSTVLQVERGEGTSMKNLVKILRMLDRLDSLGQFFEEKHLSPLEYQRFESGMKIRKRASKKKDNDTDIDSAPVW